MSHKLSPSSPKLSPTLSPPRTTAPELQVPNPNPQTQVPSPRHKSSPPTTPLQIPPSTGPSIGGAGAASYSYGGRARQLVLTFSFGVGAWRARLCLGEGKRCAAVGARGTRSSNVALRPVDLHARARERTHTAVGRIPPCGWTRPLPALTPTNTTYPTQATLSTNISAILPLHLHRRALPSFMSHPIRLLSPFPPLAVQSEPPLRLARLAASTPLPPCPSLRLSVRTTKTHSLNIISSRTPLHSPKHPKLLQDTLRASHRWHVASTIIIPTK
ncbi:hypothetical protein PCL_11716 [Purpureocillium lilacinum]|uniref:Uncharacterized protein n=1 Tax=Purpureocillium lilacinum TaxID=33203 RepID=A0A2U3EAV9_PURLI|nr:hypothetical protein PCL_11716 [Purpureocillium lilacinum]